MSGIFPAIYPAQPEVLHFFGADHWIRPKDGVLTSAQGLDMVSRFCSARSELALTGLEAGPPSESVDKQSFGILRVETHRWRRALDLAVTLPTNAQGS
jgi:hypothetical protein